MFLSCTVFTTLLAMNKINMLYLSSHSWSQTFTIGVGLPRKKWWKYFYFL